MTIQAVVWAAPVQPINLNADFKIT